MRAPHPRAFTLFELAVVATIALIVGAILFFGARDFFTRAKVMKVAEEQALLARALENYRVDYRSYPPPAEQLNALLAPTAYVATLPSDPFSERDEAPSYRYFHQPGGGFAWAVVSPGPDGEFDFIPASDPVNAPEVSAATGAAMTAGAYGGDAMEDFETLSPYGAYGSGPTLRRGAAFASGPTWPPAGAHWPKMAKTAPAPAGPVASTAAPASEQEGPARPDPSVYVDRESFRRYAGSVTYDPTNGLGSAGDIIKLSNY
jgi:type II secretory pathway pseudopilin PulG